MHPCRPVVEAVDHEWFGDLAGDLGYVDDGEVTGMFTAAEPYPLSITLEESA